MTTAAAPDVRLSVRPMRRPADDSFVSGNFIRWFRDSDHTRGIRNTEFFSIFKAQWEAVLQTFAVLVAYPEGDDSGELAGFIAYKGDTVAALYVKHTPWRRCGVARRLLAEARLSKSRPVWLLYGSSAALKWARAGGWDVSLVPATQAVRLMLGVA